jgi:two-component system, chemotaxis family, protein-glutamate methylesterase/glutaminase
MAEDKIAYKLVTIGGSAGSLEVILHIVSVLPATSGASFIIIVHRRYDTDSILENLLSTRTLMAVKEVEDKESLLPDTIYIAPPDYHLLLEDETAFSLDTSEKVHFSRPSIDVTFQSVAEIFGKKAIGVLLSGANADGAAGLENIKKAGGLTIVQDPATADMPFMPQQAINRNIVDNIVKAEELPAMLQRLLQS